MTRSAAILGLGERGKRWVTLFQTAGWKVRGFDPDPLAGTVGVPEDGWQKMDTISAATHGADWVMLCLPDRLELAQMVIQRAQAEAPETSLVGVCSDTFEIDDVQNCSIRPGRVVVLRGRPQSGVDLLVSSRNDDALRVNAIAVLSEFGDDVLRVDDAKVQQLRDFRSA